MIMAKRTFFSLLYALICIVSFGQEFVHPGMLHTTSDLEFMKAKVLAGEEPWKEAWNQLKSSEIASLNYKPTPFKVVDNGPYNKPDNGGKEFAAAYTMALQWYVEGDKAYAEKAIEIFNAWAQTLESVVNHNRQLKVGTAGIKYLNAAEIIKHTYKGWNAKDRKAFEDMVINVWYPVIKAIGMLPTDKHLCVSASSSTGGIFLTLPVSNCSMVIRMVLSKTIFMKAGNARRVDVTSSTYRWGLLSLPVPPK